MTRNTVRGLLPLVVLLVLDGSHAPAAEPPSPAGALDPADARELDDLLSGGLFDPTKRPFVKFQLPVRDVWTGMKRREVYGWLVEPAGGSAQAPARAASPKATTDAPWAVLETGEAVPVTGPVAPANFAERCEAILEAASARAAARKRRAEAAATRPATTNPAGPQSRRRPRFRVERDDDDDEADGLGPPIRLGFGSVRFAEAKPAAYLAAWLRRTGRNDLAARMLGAARAEPVKTNPAATAPTSKPAQSPAQAAAAGRAKSVAELAADEGPIPHRADPWHWFSSAVHAYMVGADAEALFYLRRMAEYHPAAMQEPKAGADDRGDSRERGYPQAGALLAELERRQKEGTFAGAGAASVWPLEFAGWPAERRAAFLIAQLQEVDARQWGQPGGVDLSSDPRVAMLIEIGDAAVPALIDCVEKDERLTRSVHFWRDFANTRTVLGVREAALSAVMSILRVTVFEPAATGDNFTSRGRETAKQTAERLRAYWKTYGKMPFEDRMMTVLTDPKTTPEAWREAAANLATAGGKKVIATTVFSGRQEPREPGTGNPAVAKFKNPTAAEAILVGMGRDLARHDAAPRDSLYDYSRRRIESHYVDALIELEDRSIVPALLRRLENSPSLRMRRMLAVACFALGEARPLTDFAADVRDGKVTIPDARRPDVNENEQPAAVEMTGIVHTLAGASRVLPAADVALWAIADPAHPLYPHVERGVRGASGRGYGEEGAWLAHPFFLRVLRADLDDPKPTGKTWAIEKDETGERLAYKEERSRGSSGVPEILADPAARRDRADERACDEAAERISKMILGVRPCHPLFKDADQRIVELRQFLDAHLAHLRRATYAETEVLGRWSMDVAYVLNVRPLGAGATADDVKAGRAIFHFDGKGTPLPLKTPAAAVLKRDLPPARPPTDADAAAGRARTVWVQNERDRDEPRQKTEWVTPRVLVLQAERGPDGKAYYGVVSADGVRRVSEDEVAEVKPAAGQ